MKKYLLILLLALFASCEDDKKASQDYSENNEDTTESLPPGNIQEERDAVQTDKVEPKRVTTTLNGRYRKMVKDQPATDCNCNCIDISFEGNTEWCIVKDKVYINARSQKTGENTADLYFVNASRDQDAERPIPWDEFDTDVPIASIEFQPDGSAKLNWIGFSSGGEIAADYAIYGKKTLEGTYKKD